MRVPLILAVLVLAIPALAGCSGKPAVVPEQPIDDLVDDSNDLKVTADTGGIRGVVVDSAIRPVANATVSVVNGETVKSDPRGLFSFTGLKEGDYFIAVKKAGYTSIQTAVHVTAGVANPDVVKVLIDQIAGKQPYIEFNKLDGFYECTFGTQIWVDSCDFGLRTVYDGTNGTAPTPYPRTVLRTQNTQFIQITADTQAIVQEGYWNDPQVVSMQVVIDSTPIDPIEDNSEHEYLHTQGASPTYGRLDNVTAIHGQLVAARGFFPFNPIPVLDNPSNPAEYAPAVATNFQFTVVTTLFHNYDAPAEWTFATSEQFPIGG